MGLLSRIRARFTRKTTTTQTSTSQPSFAGPTRPGTDVETFRRTGVSQPSFAGPTRPGTDVETFRRTGVSQPQTTVQKILKPSGIERQALIRREQLRQEAIRRKRGFSRIEAQRFLGGAKFVTALRSAKRKGFRVKKDVEEKGEKKFDILKERKKSGFFVLEKKKEKRGVEKLIEEAEKRRIKLRTKLERGKKLTPKEEAELAGVVVAKDILETSLAVKSLGKLPEKALIGIRKLIDDPKNIQKIPTKTLEKIKKIPREIKKGGKEFGRTIKISPIEAIALIGTEILLFKGTGKALKVTGKLSSKATTIISPKFRRVKGGKIIIPSTEKGRKLTLEIGGPVKKLGEPLKEQVRIAGKKVTAVSAQADRLVNLVKTKRVVRKPIPGEEFLSKRTKKLLSRFDRGRINKKQLINLDNRIRIETQGAGNLLERSFFADPKGRLRPSRLGRESPDASLLDILAGDVSFKTPKPQVLIFEETLVEKFPKSLKVVEDKLKKGKKLTDKEAKQLLNFQLKKTGKFKPIGALTKEPEVTLAPGEIIKKQKTLAVTLINGRRVPIVSVKVVKAKPLTKKLLKKAKSGKITAKELKQLRKNLKKETGFKSTISRSKKPRPIVRARPIPRIKVKGRRIPSTKRRVSQPPRKPGRVVRKTPVLRKGTIQRRPSKKARIGRGGRGGRVPPRPLKPVKKIAAFPRKKKKPFKKKPITKKQAFNVFARPLKKIGQKKKPKLIKVNKKPLTKERAKDLGSSVVDTSLSRRFKIKPTGGKPKKGVLKAPSRNFDKTKRKFRNFRIVKGKRVPLRNTFIEKRGRALLDTRGEKQGITLRRRIKQLNAKAKKSKQSKKTTRKGRKR